MKLATIPIIKLTLTLTTILLANQSVVSQAATDKVNLDSLCYKFPLNSHCQNYKYPSDELRQKELKVSRESLCTKFPQNSNCLQSPPQVTKIQLDRSGENDEWIRIERQDNVVKVSHITQVKDGLVSGILNGALGLVPVPLPFVEANKYNWKEHQVTSVTFQPNNCQTDFCQVTGTDTLTLPEGTNIHSGLLTIKYQEGKLARSLTFQVPPDAKTETITSVTITIPDSYSHPN